MHPNKAKPSKYLGWLLGNHEAFQGIWTGWISELSGQMHHQLCTSLGLSSEPSSWRLSGAEAQGYVPEISTSPRRKWCLIYRERQRFTEFLKISSKRPLMLEMLVLQMDTLPILQLTKKKEKKQKVLSRLISYDFSGQTPWKFGSFFLFINLYNDIKLFIWVPGYFAADFTEKLDVFFWDCFSLPRQGLWVDSHLVADLLGILIRKPLNLGRNKQWWVLMDSFSMSWQTANGNFFYLL